ncbi:HNH endonuclease signature motif containing protein [Micrococcoides hystricis]|uniref:DUF222 domain-containing protein n=1 Tax=Micrococcoides hystricis TaxID=1572761 RepID=A0ABV6PD18_9MICC
MVGPQSETHVADKDELEKNLRRCVDEVTLQLSEPNPAPDWDTSAVEQVQRISIAAKYRILFQKILSFARQDHAHLGADDLTSSFLMHENKGKLIRSAAAAYSAVSGMKTAQAKHEIMSAVILHEHGAELLAHLISGTLSLRQLDSAVAKLKSLPPPSPEGKPDGQPWQPGEFQQAATATEKARKNLATDLAAIAGNTHSENDFNRQAARARDARHPESFAQRAARAATKRYIKFIPADDGMTRVEGYIPSHAGLFLHHILSALAASYRTLGQAHGRSRNNLMADLLIDLVQNNPYLKHAMQIAQQRQTESGDGIEQPGGVIVDEDTGATIAQGLLNREGGATAHAEDAVGVGFHNLPPGVLTHVIVTMDFEQFVKHGGCLDEETMGFTRQHYPELYELARQNQEFYKENPLKRRRRYPVGVDDAESGACSVGTDTVLSPQATADIIASASMMSMILTDPVEGYPLGVGRKTSRPSARMRMLTAFRDRHCRYPGCREPLSNCELDHVVEWRDGGGSDYSSLSYLCKSHHMHKSARWMTATLHPELGDGVMSFANEQSGEEHLSTPEFPLAAAAWEPHQKYQAQLAEPPF